jgi:hypothetical protein
MRERLAHPGFSYNAGMFSGTLVVAVRALLPTLGEEPFMGRACATVLARPLFVETAHAWQRLRDH